jgi:vacuolar protein sorting-associated protein 13A/C
VRADVKMSGPTILVAFSTADEWPFLIENSSGHQVQFSQEVQSSVYHRTLLTRNAQILDQQGVQPTTTYTLGPHTTLSYAWDYPAARDKRLALYIGNNKRIIDVMEIGDLIPFRFAVSIYVLSGICLVIHLPCTEWVA